MSTWNDPGKLEAAGKSVVDGLSLPLYTGETILTVNTGEDDDELKLPSVVFAVVGDGEEIVKGTGIWRTPAVVRVTSSATIPMADHRTRSATVFDAFANDGIAATFSALANFHCYEVNHRAPAPARKEPRGDDPEAFIFVSEMQLEVVWCGSDIS